MSCPDSFVLSAAGLCTKEGLFIGFVYLQTTAMSVAGCFLRGKRLENRFYRFLKWCKGWSLFSSQEVRSVHTQLPCAADHAVRMAPLLLGVSVKQHPGNWESVFQEKHPLLVLCPAEMLQQNHFLSILVHVQKASGARIRRSIRYGLLLLHLTMT